MATCRDCLHGDVCKFKDLPAPLSDSYIRESECIEKRCGDFKDRSRFVELPCKVYTTFSGRVVEAKICGYEASMKNSIYNWVIEPQHFGKYVFFTLEEAEQALAKRNQPNNTPQ